jgi:hypothetical protein
MASAKCKKGHPRRLLDLQMRSCYSYSSVGPSTVCISWPRGCGLGPLPGRCAAGLSFAPRQPIGRGRGLLLGSGSCVGCVAMEPAAVHICSARREDTPGHLQQQGSLPDLPLAMRFSLHTHQDRCPLVVMGDRQGLHEGSTREPHFNAAVEPVQRMARGHAAGLRAWGARLTTPPITALLRLPEAWTPAPLGTTHRG